jgi:hypothetical protein
MTSGAIYAAVPMLEVLVLAKLKPFVTTGPTGSTVAAENVWRNKSTASLEVVATHRESEISDDCLTVAIYPVSPASTEDIWVTARLTDENVRWL